LAYYTRDKCGSACCSSNRQAIIPATPQVIPTDKVHLKPASRELMTKSLVSVNNTIKSFVSFQYFEIIETIIVTSFAIIAA
jgi:hypothetical protein